MAGVACDVPDAVVWRSWPLFGQGFPPYGVAAFVRGAIDHKVRHPALVPAGREKGPAQGHLSTAGGRASLIYFVGRGSWPVLFCLQRISGVSPEISVGRFLTQPQFDAG